MTKEFHIELDFCKAEILIIRDSSIAKGYNYTVRKYDCIPEKDNPGENTEGYVYHPENHTTIFLYIKTGRINLPILLHELHHVNFYLLNQIGIKLNHKTDEVYAYHYQMIYEKVIKAIK